MAKLGVSSKHLQISKANTVITATVAIASFLTVASLFATKALWGQRTYQSKVIVEKEKAAKTLKDNLAAVDSLVEAYETFVTNQTNIIGGTPQGQGPKDGDNAKLTLDALPSIYDFPALTSSLEKVLVENGLKIEQIAGTDDEIAQGSNESSTPQVVEMPFLFAVQGDYDQMFTIIGILEKSIRPIQTQKLLFTAKEQKVQLDMEAKTFYQSEKGLNITKKVIR